MTGFSEDPKTPVSPVSSVADFCQTLVRNGIRYHMDVCSDYAIMVTVAVPGERWEIEFMENGEVQIERFVSEGVEDCEKPLEALLEWYKD